MLLNLCDACPADLDDSEAVDLADFLAILSTGGEGPDSPRRLDPLQDDP